MSSINKIVASLAQPAGGFLPASLFKKTDFAFPESCSTGININNAVLSAAVDYLVRYEVSNQSFASFQPLLDAANKVGEKEKASNLISQIKDLGNDSIVNCAKLAGYDAIRRLGPNLFAGIDGISPDTDTIQTIRVLVNRAVSLIGSTDSVKQVSLPLSTELSNVDECVCPVLGSKGVLLVKSSSVPLNNSQTLQLLIIYLLVRHTYKRLVSDLESISVINPKNCTVETCEIKTIAPASVQKVAEAIGLSKKEINAFLLNEDKGAKEIFSLTPVAKKEIVEEREQEKPKEDSVEEITRKMVEVTKAYSANPTIENFNAIGNCFEELKATKRVLEERQQKEAEAKAQAEEEKKRIKAEKEKAVAVETAQKAEEDQTIKTAEQPQEQKNKTTDTAGEPSVEKIIAQANEQPKIEPICGVASQTPIAGSIQDQVFFDASSIRPGDQLFLAKTGEKVSVQRIEGNYIYVRKNGAFNDTIFQFPKSIGISLFQRQTKEMVEREERLADPYIHGENEFEKQKFNQTEEYISKKVEQYHEDYEDSSTRANEALREALKGNKIENVEWANTLPEIGLARLHDQTEESRWTAIGIEPYFARIQRGEKDYYLGKTPVEKLNILDWRSPDARYFYQWRILTTQEKEQVKLVRSLDISGSAYFGYQDLFNTVHPSMVVSEEDTQTIMSTDSYLTSLLKESRQRQGVHDIIKSIQKNQYDMVTYSGEENMLVNGCAGSGKTMIIYHRLSYLAYDKENFDVTDHLVISPSDALTMQTNSLVKELHLESVQTLKMESVFALAKERYAKTFDFALINQDYERREKIGDESDEKIGRIYDISSLDSVYQRVVEILIDQGNARTNFIDNEKTVLNKLSTEVFEKKRIVKATEFEIRREPSFLLFKRWITLIKKCSFSELNFIVKNGSNDAEGSSMRMRRIIAKLLSFSPDLPESNYASDRNRISNDVWRMLGSFCIASSTANTEDARQIVESESQETMKLIGRMDSPSKSTIDLFSKMFVPMYSLYKRISGFDEFVDGKPGPYLYSVINTEIDVFKKQRRLDLEANYGFEDMYFAYILARLYGPVFRNSTYFFIDEFQNFSLTELTVLRKLYSNIRIDAFGDPYQCLEKKGENIFKTLVSDPQWKPFYIKENYRNSYEITDYLNQEFAIGMNPIGIHGSMITYEKFSDAIERWGFESKAVNDRFAVIALDYVIRQLKTKLPSESLNIIDDENSTIDNTKINMLTPEQAKGLEFEKAVVVTYGMTNQEKYVACSRPLSDLYVVERSKGLI